MFTSDDPTKAAYSDRQKNPSHTSAKLFSNVQSIYELILPPLELHSLGAAFEMSHELSSLTLLNDVDDERLRKRLAYFKPINGTETDYSLMSLRNRTRSVNQYLTHWRY